MPKHTAVNGPGEAVIKGGDIVTGLGLVEAKVAIEAWRIDYNTVRPHSSLAGRTPAHLAAISVGLAG